MLTGSSATSSSGWGMMARHRDALQLPAGKLVRIAPNHAVGSKPHIDQHLVNRFMGFLFALGPPDIARRLKEIGVHRLATAKALKGVLKDGLHPPAKFPQLRTLQTA